MIIYLASTAPGTEGVKEREIQTKKRKLMCDIKMRLLSYYHIKVKDLYCDVIYKEIKRINH